MTLAERIDRKEKVVPLRRQPEWIRRMQEKGLPNQDRTSYVLGSFVPKGSDGAA